MGIGRKRVGVIIRELNVKQHNKWRNSVMSRDKYTCKRCGYKGSRKKDIQAHHIKTFANYPTLRYEVNNGITLCKKCHRLMNGCEESFERMCNLLLLKKSTIAMVGNLLRAEERREEEELNEKI
jgi:hypothetical protein